MLRALKQSLSLGPWHWEAGLPPHMGAGIAPEISIFLSQTPLLGESTRLVPARAEMSRHVFCSRCHHSQTRQTRCWGQGRTWGSGAGTVTPPGLGARRGSRTSPTLVAAVLLKKLRCSLGRWMPTNRPREGPVWPAPPPFFPCLAEA